MVQKIFWCILIFALTSCVPSPWTKVDYKSPKTREYNLQNQPEPDGNDSHLWLKGAFLKLFLRAHDETIYAGSAPYRLFIVAYGQQDRQQTLKVHHITVKTTSGTRFKVTPTVQTLQAGQLKTQVLSFPAEIAFTPIDPQNPVWTIASVITENEIAPQPQEELEVSVDLEVITPTGSERRVLQDTFVPVTQSGWFQSLD